VGSSEPNATVRRGTRVWRALARPWLLALALCGATYVALYLAGLARFRSEFLGASVVLGGLGGLCLVSFRALRGPVWLHAMGLFFLNWLFAAYAISFLAV
jgi:hypothetical protein